jgi:hypothetical protein
MTAEDNSAGCLGWNVFFFISFQEKWALVRFSTTGIHCANTIVDIAVSTPAGGMDFCLW